MPSIEQLQKIIDNSQNIVFFGGAGVSTESGIPDFRSADGLYHEEWKFPPETIISRSFFDSNTAEFYRFYRAKMIAADAKPNTTHFKLVELEKAGKLSAIVTQNIDGLHSCKCQHLKKDYKLALKRGLKPKLLEDIITILANGDKLPEKYRDHDLVPSKHYKGMRECHIQPDWLLIYKIDKECLILTLIRTGSHSDLF